MKFYDSIFKNARILGPVNFQLDGQEFMAFDGGAHITFAPAISLFGNCETQQEVDELWEKLVEGVEKGRCGWLKDKYGLSQQNICSDLGEPMQDKDAPNSARVRDAMRRSNKLEIKGLQLARPSSTSQSPKSLRVERRSQASSLRRTTSICHLFSYTYKVPRMAIPAGM